MFSIQLLGRLCPQSLLLPPTHIILHNYFDACSRHSNAFAVTFDATSLEITEGSHDHPKTSCAPPTKKQRNAQPKMMQVSGGGEAMGKKMITTGAALLVGVEWEEKIFPKDLWRKTLMENPTIWADAAKQLLVDMDMVKTNLGISVRIYSRIFSSIPCR